MPKRNVYPILLEGLPKMALIGERLKDDLLKVNMKYTELSRLSGVDDQLIGRLCRDPDTIPDLRALAAIAKARRHTVDWYVWEQPQPLAAICEFFTYQWGELTEDEQGVIINTMRLAESSLSQRRVMQRYREATSPHPVNH